MVSEPSMAESQSASVKKIGLAALVAIVVAALVFIGAVLPAEHGIDPLSTGEFLGLLALAQVVAITTEDVEYRTDSFEMRVAPSEWVEYTYRLRQGGTMLYTWKATGPVEYNFHSAPDGAPPGYAESFDAAESVMANGSYVAPFTGVHGWYWENIGNREVTITLSTAGFYRDAHVARDRADGYRDLMDARGNVIR